MNILECFESKSVKKSFDFIDKDNNMKNLKWK